MSIGGKIMNIGIKGKIFIIFIIGLFFVGSAQIGLSSPNEKAQNPIQPTGTQTTFNPFTQGWLYRKQITIDHTKVSDTLVNFPVIVSTTDTDLKTKTQSDGDDILFMDTTGAATQLSHEIEQYDQSVGTLVAWVNLPTISSSQDTIFYMYYGNPSCSSQQNPATTWDSNYLAIWHMNNADGAQDSTGDHDATPVVPPTYQANGKIGFAETFSGSQFLSADNPQTMVGLDAITIEAWIKINYDSTGAIVVDTFNSDYDGDAWRFVYTMGGTLAFYMEHNTPSNQDAHVIATDILVGTWYHLTGTWTNGNKLNIYKNSIFAAESPSNFSGMINRPDTNAFIGAEHDTHSTLFHYLYGTIDEIRISNIARSPAWISTSYSNQNDPSSFYSIGIELQQTPPATPQRPSGTIKGDVGTEYSYTTVTTDPDNSILYYMWSWGDGNTSGWYGPFDSNVVESASHVWTTKGTYAIRVKAKDMQGSESNWSEPLSAVMPFHFEYHGLLFFEKLFERFPNAFPLLRQLLRH
jgi:hypothetical protein